MKMEKMGEGTLARLSINRKVRFPETFIVPKPADVPKPVSGGVNLSIFFPSLLAWNHCSSTERTLGPPARFASPRGSQT